MPTHRRLVVAGVITLVASLLILFPARVAYHWFAPAGIAMAGIQGTIWSGSAADADAVGVYLSDMTWSMRPLKLLTGKLAFKIEGSPAGGFIDTEAAATLGGELRLMDMRASVALTTLETVVNVRGMRGTANAEFERIDIRDGVAVAAIGNLEINSLILPLLARDAIGSYKAEFFTQEDGIVASVEDTGGVLDIAGRLLLRPDNSYQFLGQVAAKPGAPQSVLQQLQYLGSADERGQRELRLEGSL